MTSPTAALEVDVLAELELSGVLEEVGAAVCFAGVCFLVTGCPSSALAEGDGRRSGPDSNSGGGVREADGGRRDHAEPEQPASGVVGRCLARRGRAGDGGELRVVA